MKYANTEKNISYPFLGYNCYYDEKKQQYKNVSLSIKNDSLNDESENFNMIDHHLFGNHFYFTCDPIVSPSTIFNFREEKKDKEELKRYCFFVDDTKYVLKDIGDADFQTINDINDNLDEYSSIYFRENNIQLWCIKDIYSIAII